MLELFHSEISSVFLMSGIVLSTWGALVTKIPALTELIVHLTVHLFTQQTISNRP